MRRDQALAIFDALIVDGYNATLSAWHGVAVETNTVGTDESHYGPMYVVATAPRDRRQFTGDEVGQLTAIGENLVARVLIDHEGSGLVARFVA